ncbi:MAG: HAMP domain-containing protein [Alphaproteobacteria bacterium]|nr:HAMP domain-containing protein [Alphaproteobacteria bacterium]MDE2492459.1 HAMP domain-containing protein [Alphaproteobacteria bacterium]
MGRQTLKFKIGLYLSVTLSVAVGLFILLVASQQRDELLNTVAGHVTELSGVITKSLRFAMLRNQPTYVDTVIRDVAAQPGIDRIRIFSKEGRITHSTYAPEIGHTVNRKAEDCSSCHGSGKPLEEIPKSKRTWTFTTPGGHRLLGTMEVIRNEPSCYNAACHHHPPNSVVLGVLDIRYSLDGMDRKVHSNVLTISAFALGFVVVASLLVAFFVHRLIFLPLRDLESGAKNISSGNLEQQIPVRSEDEFGRLAGSFNAMTVALRHSRAELREWARTLEQKVERRTEQLRIAQAEAAQGEKLASVGLLASGIAHELNNPLTGVLTFSHLLREKMPDGSQDAEDMDLVIRETKRCAVIIRRLLDFARDKPLEKKFADLNQIIKETTRFVERPAHLNNIDISLDLDPALPEIWGDPDQMKQVVMNLLVNAQHAIDGEGSIVIRTRRLPQPKALQAGATPVPAVELSIRDTGCGISKENLGRIFDPFFTTKEVGIGTGLGLSVTHGIVEAHGGTIELESEVGKGSTFRVYLPLTKSPEVAESEKSGSST